jgi:hypothetical protein
MSANENADIAGPNSLRECTFASSAVILICRNAKRLHTKLSSGIIALGKKYDASAPKSRLPGGSSLDTMIHITTRTYDIIGKRFAT